MTVFAEHFPFREFQRRANAKGVMAFSDVQVEYAARLSQLLELFRAELGDRAIVLTSWLRPDSDTQHGEGTASDQYLPAGVTELDVLAAADRLEARGVKWGQLIVYPFSGPRHWHISLPTGQARNARMVQLFDTGGDSHNRDAYRPLTAAMLADFPRTPATPGSPLEVLTDVATSGGTLGALLFALGLALMLGG